MFRKLSSFLLISPWLFYFVILYKKCSWNIFKYGICVPCLVKIVSFFPEIFLLILHFRIFPVRRSCSYYYHILVVHFFNCFKLLDVFWARVVAIVFEAFCIRLLPWSYVWESVSIKTFFLKFTIRFLQKVSTAVSVTIRTHLAGYLVVKRNFQDFCI